MKRIFNWFSLGIKTLFFNKATVPILTFIIVTILTNKALLSKEKLNSYDNYFLTIDSKLSNTINLYYLDISDIGDYKNNSIMEYVNCINNKVNYIELPDNIKNNINELEKLYNSSYNYFSFKYMDINTGFTISYNEFQTIFTASTIKAPEVIYIYEKKKELLDNKLTYTSNYYNTGTGILKNTSFNQDYTIRQLSEYAIRYSDNAAHNMLMDYLGRENMLEFWSNLGTTAIFTENSNWGIINSHDGVIYMNELYNYYKFNDLGTELMNNYLNATFKLITNKDGKYNTANKTGWSGSVIHDAAIVFEENPYILVILTNLGYDSYDYLFSKTSTLIGTIHEEYWNYKYNECRKFIK